MENQGGKDAKAGKKTSKSRGPKVSKKGKSKKGVKKSDQMQSSKATTKSGKSSKKTYKSVMTSNKIPPQDSPSQGAHPSPGSYPMMPKDSKNTKAINPPVGSKKRSNKSLPLAGQNQQVLPNGQPSNSKGTYPIVKVPSRLIMKFTWPVPISISCSTHWHLS